mgnify:FL=1
MRKLLIPLLASLLLPTAVYSWWGKYNSQIEAEKACDKWKRNGIRYSADVDWKDKVLKTTNRYCRLEASTRQYLGYERTGVKRDRHYTEEEYKNLIGTEVIKKYFRY